MGGSGAVWAVLISLAFVSEASAQLICPPGTTIRPSNSPFNPYQCAAGPNSARPQVASSLPAKSSLTPPKREVPPRAAAAQEAARPADSGPAACKSFNARLASVHHEFADTYGDRAREQDHSVKRLESAVERQDGLARELTQQAGRMRDLTLRRHYRLQAAALREDNEGKRQELSSLRSSSAEDKARVKSDYQGRMRALLAERPQGCEVALAK